MLRAMYSGISGLNNFQTALDVVGNNIANADTVGFKSSGIDFGALLTQVLRTGSAPTATAGGTNPVQVGLGSQIAATPIDFSQGDFKQTGVSTNLAISGKGMFVVNDGGQQAYTRAGAFSFDANGNLVDPSGHEVLGWAVQNGTLPTLDAANLQPISIPLSTSTPAIASQNASIVGNLSADATTGTTYSTSLTLYDSLGSPEPVTVTFKNTGIDAWSWSATIPTTATAVGSGTLTFSTTGSLTAGTTGTIAFTPSGAAALSTTVSFASLTGYAGQSSASVGTVDGAPAGTLASFSVDRSGVVTGVFSNGHKEVLGQVALAAFSNPGGLQALGGGVFASSNNSGTASVGAAGTGGRGTLTPGALELSNVNMARAFTEMMVAENAFQANAKVLTVSQAVLNSLVQTIH